MRDEGVPPSTLRHPGDDQQRIIFTHFIRATRAMHNIDELFSWITMLMVQQFRIPVAQVWAAQQVRPDVSYPVLRGSAKQDQSFPDQLIINTQIADAAQIALREGRSLSLELIDNTFPLPFAAVLHRYGLHYSAPMVLKSSDFFLPPAAYSAPEQIPTPLAIILWLFFNQAPSYSEFLGINGFWQKIPPIARSRGLLLAAPGPVSPAPSLSQQRVLPDLFALIPHRTEDPAENPLASSSLIPDASARRFYAAINDRRTVSELCALARLEREEAMSIIQKLLDQSRIELYEPGGQFVEHSSLFSVY